MSIRRRLALVLAAVVMSMVVVIAGLTWWLAATNVRDSIDDQLRDQAVTARSIVAESSDFVANLRPTNEPLEERAFLLRIIAPDGTVLGDTELPADRAQIDEVRASGTESLRTVMIEERTFRVLTLAQGDLVIQLGTDVTSVENGLEDLRNGARLVGLVGVLVAALLGWVIADRFAKPIIEVSKGAAQLAQNSTLPEPIVSDRRDEIGELAGSFNELLDALQASRVQQTRLVEDAAHELGTPLTSLRLKIDFLRSEPDLPADRRTPIVDGVAAELEALSALVAELLDLAASTHSDEAPRRIDLGDIVEESAQRARVTTGRTITTSTQHVTVEGRPASIRRALSNLIVNAHKYSPDGTPIEIHEFAGGIEVRDHGPGIAAADRPRAFDRFFRAKNTQHIDGSGVGLAIVKQIAEIHGGKVWIDDAPDGGAVVGFSVSTD